MAVVCCSGQCVVGWSWVRVCLAVLWLCFSQAFNMIDQNRDGFIDNEDLKDMLASLGQTSVY